MKTLNTVADLIHYLEQFNETDFIRLMDSKGRELTITDLVMAVKGDFDEVVILIKENP